MDLRVGRAFYGVKTARERGRKNEKAPSGGSLAMHRARVTLPVHQEKLGAPGNDGIEFTGSDDQGYLGWK
jgi:hypothetical protein